MKSLIFLIIIIVIGYLIYGQFIAPPMAKLNQCLEIAQIEVSGPKNSQASCYNKFKTYEEMNDCILNNQKTSFVGGIVYLTLGIQKNVEQELAIHNSNCPSNQLAAPSAQIFSQEN